MGILDKSRDACPSLRAPCAGHGQVLFRPHTVLHCNKEGAPSRAGCRTCQTAGARVPGDRERIRREADNGAAGDAAHSQGPARLHRPAQHGLRDHQPNVRFTPHAGAVRCFGARTSGHAEQAALKLRTRHCCSCHQGARAGSGVSWLRGWRCQEAGPTAVQSVQTT